MTIGHSPPAVRSPAEAHLCRLAAACRSADGPATRRLGIAGAGVMGAAIAAEALDAGLACVLVDSDGEAAGRAAPRVAGLLQSTPAAEGMARLRVETEVRALASCDVVIESIGETVDAKQALYRQLAGVLSPQAVLATNTSTIPIARLAEAVPAAERFCGMHFFHPVRQRPLVELVAGGATGATTLACLAALAARLKKTAIRVGDRPGFLVNRLLLPYLTEALELLREGTPAESIERAATDFGMAMGPLSLLDEIGLDTALRGGWILYSAFPDRVAASPLLVAMVKAGRLGKKSAGGFLDQGRLDPAAERVIARCLQPVAPLAEPAIQERLFLPMLVEAAHALDEGHVGPAEVDLGVVYGLGFPAARGGLLGWADSLGADAVVRRLDALAHLGPRVVPTERLRTMAADGGRFWPAADPWRGPA